MKPGKTGIERLVDATRYSFKGLAAAFRNEAAFRQEILLVAVLLIASFWLQSSLLEWLALVLPLFVLLVVELVNSAIEAIVDRIGSERHELSGRAKDMGSAAVFLSLLMIATAWGAVLWSRFHG
ncbi:MAG: diacylglycerol kinase [Xanthomonadales bacterium]|nr:diacylglycerol kinase [Xanthomonadales bacterium]NIX14045.1 diacylglycerol kinase [Xanthomonadales bacterium]